MAQQPFDTGGVGEFRRLPESPFALVEILFQLLPDRFQRRGIYYALRLWCGGEIGEGFY